MATFVSLGVHFPLFDAPVSEAPAFVGAGTCSLCHELADVCFELGIGCDVVIRCASCGSEVGLDADDRVDATCARCDAVVRFPGVPEQLLCCFACLRAGRAAITQDTELGMVAWEHALQGLTHGLPGLDSAEFEMVPTDSDWVRARVDSESLFELLRTPTYSTIQGERWLFCCRKPMVFVGAWGRERFAANAANGDGKALLASVLGEEVPGLWENALHDVTGIYVFTCRQCSKLRGHWDIA